MRERYVQLLAALCLMFLLYPLTVELGLTRWFRLVLMMVLVVSAYAVSGSRRVLMMALGLGLPAAVAQANAVALPSRSAVLVAAILGLLFLTFVTIVILGSVLSPGKVTRDKIAGAICVYLLLGLIWSLGYAIVAVTTPEAFRAPEEITSGLAGGSHAFMYFSFVTLTTLGFGDISPVAPISQTLAWFEAVTGQLYLTILVARLVGLHISHSEQKP